MSVAKFLCLSKVHFSFKTCKCFNAQVYFTLGIKGDKGDPGPRGQSIVGLCGTAGRASE